MTRDIMIFVTLLCLAFSSFNIGCAHGYSKAMRDAEEALKETLESLSRMEDDT